MTLPELSVRRHVLALMISVAIVLFGAIGLRDVGVDRIPNIEMPVINVSVSMSGAAPEIIDTAITEVIERRVNRVPGVETIRAVSSPGEASIDVVFGLGQDIDTVFNEVQSKVNEVLASLPEDASPPVVSKLSGDSSPILWLAVTGERDLYDLYMQATRIIRPQIENVPGVAEVLLGGGAARNIRIHVETARLAALGVTVSDITSAIQREHVQMSGGYLVAGQQQDLIQLDLEYHDLLEFERMPVLERGGSVVRLADVARIEDGLADQVRIARFDGKEAVGLAVIKVAGTNTVAIADEVKRRLADQIAPGLPPGLDVDIAYDESIFITDQIASLELTILIGIAISALVILIFLKSFRSTVIVSLSIPVSIMAAVAVLYFFGYTLNAVTMLALLLLVGVVVDDAIVVLENIYRHRGAGDRRAAAVAGANEVFFAVIASTLALVSIFASVIFLDAVIGRFFQSFAMVVTFGVIVSSLVALTLIPMLASRFVPVRDTEGGRLARLAERGLAAIDEGYRRVLRAALARRWLSLVLLLALLGVMALPLRVMHTEFAPEEDTGQFVVTMRTPLGSSLDYTQERLREIEDRLAALPEVRSIFASIGTGGAQTNQASVFVSLVDRGARDIPQQALTARLQDELADIPGTRVSISSGSLLGGDRGEALQFVLTGLDLYAVGEAAEEFLARLEQTPGMGRVELGLDLDLPQLALSIDRERAIRLGVAANEVARTANVLIGGVNVARWNDEPGDGRRYNIRLKAPEGTFASGADLARIYLRANGGRMVRMDEIATLTETSGPAAIARHDLQYAAHFFANPDMPLGEAVATVERLAAETLPPGLRVSLTGEAEEMERTARAIVFIMGLALALVYIVLASQFNSFLQPLFIMLAQPLAFAGGIAGLWLGGFTLNIFSGIGLVLLMGLVTKNGILLVDLTNQYRRDRGMNVHDALVAACPVRLRPVLMTSLTLILAMVPALVGLGAGSESHAPMAAAIIAGMLVAMVLTLVLLPVAYALVEGWRETRVTAADRAGETG